ncbi:MAG: efflux RND transporter periplasmic adaptor subunit, partial [Candidatus Sulfotelmatobacter sp.]
KGRLAIAEAAITTATARLEVAQMELRKAQSLLEYTRLRAPFDGVVTRRNVSQGTAVFAASGAASQPLLVIERTDRVRVNVDVAEQYALRVERGSPATFTLDALPGKIYSGTVARTSGFLDPNHSMRIEIDRADFEIVGF